MQKLELFTNIKKNTKTMKNEDKLWHNYSIFQQWQKTLQKKYFFWCNSIYKENHRLFHINIKKTNKWFNQLI